MSDYKNERINLYKKYKRLKIALSLLYAAEVVQDIELTNIAARIDSRYRLQRDSRRERMESEGLGAGGRRPTRVDTVICKKAGCSQPAAPGQAYCSKDHSPYGHLIK